MTSTAVDLVPPYSFQFFASKRHAAKPIYKRFLPVGRWDILLLFGSSAEPKIMTTNTILTQRYMIHYVTDEPEGLASSERSGRSTRNSGTFSFYGCYVIYITLDQRPMAIISKVDIYMDRLFWFIDLILLNT